MLLPALALRWTLRWLNGLEHSETILSSAGMAQPRAHLIWGGRGMGSTVLLAQLPLSSRRNEDGSFKVKIGEECFFASGVFVSKKLAGLTMSSQLKCSSARFVWSHTWVVQISRWEVLSSKQKRFSAWFPSRNAAPQVCCVPLCVQLSLASWAQTYCSVLKEHLANPSASQPPLAAGSGKFCNICSSSLEIPVLLICCFPP